MFLLKQILKLIKLLHTDEGTLALALGFALSLFPAFAGFGSILGLVSLFIVLFFRVQMGAYFLGIFFFSIVSLPLLGTFNSLGLSLLENPSLTTFWTSLYENPIWHWLKFNHTQILGGQVIALLAFPFMFFIFKILIQKYQHTVVKKFKNTKLYKYFSKTSAVIGYNNILDSMRS